ncbi:MAG: TetR/AcrR family transcriptional regulator [Myxococcota bacterium]
MSFERDFEHRDALRDAASKAFCEHGYGRASLSAILTAAGMSKGQFYHHFDGKEALYLALVDDMVARKRAWFDEHPVPDHGGFLATLRAQLEAGLAFSRSHPELDQFSRSFLRERGRPIFRVVMRRAAFSDGGPLDELVRRYHEAGAFHGSLSVEVVRALIDTTFERVVDLLDLTSPEQLGQRMDAIVGFLGRGLGVRLEAPEDRADEP